MKAWEEYAICDSTGIIKDILVYHIASGGSSLSSIVAHNQYGDNAFSFDVTQYMAIIGDKVIDGKVYRGNDEVTKFPTEEETIRDLERSQQDFDEAILDQEEYIILLGADE